MAKARRYPPKFKVPDDIPQRSRLSPDEWRLHCLEFKRGTKAAQRMAHLVSDRTKWVLIEGKWVLINKPR